MVVVSIRSPWSSQHSSYGPGTKDDGPIRTYAGQQPLPGSPDLTVCRIMGSDTSSAATSLPLSRLVGVGLIVFLANAVLLVLQLVAGRLLAPFIGSSLETWTSVIGVFLAGIALGNGFGGKLADRYPTPRTLAALLAVGAIAAVWMAIFPLLLTDSGVYKSIPLGPRIPLLALVLCLPAGFVLSLLTPLAIKLGLPDLASTGRVTGMVFALSTLGCLLGNYLTGFVLIPMYTINTLVFASAGALAALSLGSIVVLGTRAASEGSAQDPLLGSDESASPRVASSASGDRIQTDSDIPISSNPYAFPDIRLAFTIVFLASFGGMTLELTASRVLAGELGVSLFTWTGIIGVMLAGTALGNLTGGWITDRVNRPGSSFNPRFVLAGSLLMAAAGTVFQFVAMALISHYSLFHGLDPIEQVMGWTFCLFFLPMFALGTISPPGDPAGGSGCRPRWPSRWPSVCLEYHRCNPWNFRGRVSASLGNRDAQDPPVRFPDIDADEPRGDKSMGL